MENITEEPKTRRRNKSLFIRVTEAEKAKILERAQKLAMGLSEFLRHLLAGENV